MEKIRVWANAHVPKPKSAIEVPATYTQIYMSHEAAMEVLVATEEELEELKHLLRQVAETIEARELGQDYAVTICPVCTPHNHKHYPGCTWKKILDIIGDE